MKHLIVVSSHSEEIYTVEFDSLAKTLSLKHTFELGHEQPSWVEQSPFHRDIVYANSWISNLLFALRVSFGGALEILSASPSGGSGPTHFKVMKDGRGLAVANVSFNLGLKQSGS